MKKVAVLLLTVLLSFATVACDSKEKNDSKASSIVESTEKIKNNVEIIPQPEKKNEKPKFEIRTENGEVIISNKHLKTVSLIANEDESGIMLEFTEKGAQIFTEATKENLNCALNIYLDDNLISSPTVNTVITNGQAVLSIPDAEEAQDIYEKLSSFITE